MPAKLVFAMLLREAAVFGFLWLCCSAQTMGMGMNGMGGMGMGMNGMGGFAGMGTGQAGDPLYGGARFGMNYNGPPPININTGMPDQTVYLPNSVRRAMVRNMQMQRSMGMGMGMGGMGGGPMG